MDPRGERTTLMDISMENRPPLDHDFSARRISQNLGDTSRTTEGPSAAQWEAHKDEIRTLYDKRPLKEVKKILDAHGFVATERMYKSRLHAWGLNKNSSDKEYQVALILHHRRKEVGLHDSVFLINGNRRSLKDLRKYIKGRKMTDDQFLTYSLRHEQEGQLRDFQHVRAVSPEPEEADSKHSPASAKTPSSFTSGNSPPQKQTIPATLPSPPCFVSTHFKQETVDEGLGFQHSPTSLSPSHRSHGRRRPSIASRKKRLSWSSNNSSGRLGMDRPQFDFSPMDGIQRSEFDLAFDKRQDSTLDFPTDKTFKYGSDVLTDQTCQGTIEPPAKIESSQQYYTPRRSPPCQHFDDHDVETLAHSAVYSNVLASSYGMTNMSALKALNPPGSEDGFEVVCGKCLSPHFSSLQHVNNSPPSTSHMLSNASQETPSRAILNPSAEVPVDSFKIAPSAKEHDYCFKWVSRCFLACIHLTKHQANPDDSGSAELAEFMLSQADEIFEQMLISDDHKIVLTLNHAMTILAMHNQEAIAEKIMKRTAAVAERVVGLAHPMGVIARFLGYAVIPKKLREQTDITSTLLRHVWNHCVMTYEARERDLRTIGAMYCLGYMLNVEAGRDREPDKLVESESIMRQCYQLSCERLSKNHLQSIMALTNLRVNMERQGRIDEAIACAVTALKDSSETLGSQHPKRLELMRNLGRSYEQRSRYIEAEELYWQVLEGRVTMLGRKHGYTKGMKRDLIQFFQGQGRWVEEEDGGCPEQQRIEDMFTWNLVDEGDAQDDPEDVMAATEKQLRAY